jgi:hypothetical protein
MRSAFATPSAAYAHRWGVHYRPVMSARLGVAVCAGCPWRALAVRIRVARGGDGTSNRCDPGGDDRRKVCAFA